MKLRANEMDELALLCRDMNRGVREQLHAEDDAKAKAGMGRMWRAARGIAVAVAGLVAVVAVYAALLLLVGCGRTSEADERYRLMAAYADAETADLSEVGDLKEKSGSFSYTDCDTPQVRAREPDPRFAGCPSPCVIKIGATWCGPCQAEPITAWLRKSGWAVHAYDIDRDAAFCEPLGVRLLPTFVVVRGGREVARYSGTDIKEFLPILKAACQ